MAVDIKVAPDEKLELVQTYITDTNPNSDYFNISELPDTFSGGKNAFLIAGTDKLVSNSEIKIQIRDSAGNVCYIEYSNGAPEYYEGNSKVVAVYVYPTLTAFGPATITILGQLKDVPQEWNGLYSVKWERQVNINPALANTTRVRFYKRPAVSITEIVEPLYTIVSGSKTPSLIQGSFASIKVNQLETFAGDVKRIKVYRTSEGDISDYDLIQDILVESKNLLTTYELSGSVVGNGGLFTNDSLSKLWLTSSLHAVLDSTYVEDGLQLTGSGTLTYSSSLNLLSSNTYELELDSYFTGSANSSSSNLGIYLSYTTQSLITDKNPTPQPYTLNTTIAILSGSIPVKKFGTQTFPFNITNDYPSASLYLSQSSGTTQWHVGNISLNVSQDTAFSPNEISFVTSMPTVLTNETFNFKFEFYDVNNNYVPVAVTQSALFVGGTNFNTLQSGSLYASASVSASLAALSQSVSGTISLTSQSVSSSISATSASLSSSISKSANETSASSANFIILVSGSLSSSINVVSGSQYVLSQSVSSSIGNLSSSLLNYSSSQSSQSLYQVYSASAFLDKFIYTDENGKLNSPPTASGNGLYLGSTYLGYYSGSSWRTYMDDSGNFSLAGADPNGGFLAWSSKLQRLQVQGDINIQGGNAATTSSVTTAVNNGTASLSSSLSPNIFTSTTGLINRPPIVLVGSAEGLYLGSTNLGYYSGSAWKTYMANNGNFYLSGPGTDSLSWVGGVLTINGAINITGGNAATTTNVNDAAARAVTSGSTSASFALTNANTASIFTDATGKLTKTPATGSQTGLFLGQTYLGYYNGTDWKTYMANNGNFYLSGPGTDSLSWVGGVLTINGAINITGGNAATTTYANAQKDLAIASGSSSISALSGSVATSVNTAQSTANSAGDAANAAANKIFTDAAGKIIKVAAPTGKGLFLDSTHLGFYNTTDYPASPWRTYMDDSGNFSLVGAGSNGLSWNASTSVLSIDGNITARNGTFIGNITSTATISGGTISGGSIQGGSLSIGGNFSVSNTGNLIANNAILSGSLNANAGTIGGFTLSANSFTTSDGKLKLDTTAPAILLYDTLGGSPKVEINAASTLTNPANSNISPNWASSNGYIGTEGNRTATQTTGYGTITNFYGTISDTVAINFSGLVNFNVYTPDLVVSINTGTIAASSTFPPYSPQYTYQTYQSQYGSARRAEAYFVLQLLDTSNNLVAESATIGPSVTATGGFSYSYYQSTDGISWNYGSYTQAASATARQSFTLRNSTITIPASGTYKVRMVLKLSVSPGYITDYNTNQTTYYSATGTSNHSYTGASVSLTPNLNKLEITNGGIQIITTTDSYVKMQRNSDSGWSGGTLFQAVGGIIRGQAYGTYPDYYSNYAMNIDGYVNLNGKSGNTIGTMDYDTGTSGYTVLTINGKYSETTKSNQSRIDIANNVRPYYDDRFDLGDSSLRWRDIFTNGAVTTTSDKNKKQNITISSLGLNFINKLTPVSYKWISGSVTYEENWPTYIEKELKAGDRDAFNDIVEEDKIVLIPNPNKPPVVEIIPGKRTHYGLIAQDVKSALNDMGLTTNDFAGYVAGDVENDTELGLRYEEFISPMIKAIQELSDRVVYLESQLSGSI